MRHPILQRRCSHLDRFQRSSRALAGRKPSLERLEDRVVLNGGGEFGIAAVIQHEPTILALAIEVKNAPIPGPVDLTVYRSADRIVDAGDLVLEVQTIAALPVGQFNQFVQLDQPLGIDPARPYVIVAAAVADATPADNVASLRKWTVAAVTHGVEVPYGTMPAWVADLANSMKDQGYDAVIPFDWSQGSAVPDSQVVSLAAQGLLLQLGQVVAGLPAAGFQPNDVVDVHLVGHSRGGGVVVLAAQQLPSAIPITAGGFQKLTLLDPHPTRNPGWPNYSNSPGPIGSFAKTLFVTFQDLASDPALVVPPNVDLTEVLYQQTPATAAVTLDERTLISWGEVPVSVAAPSPLRPIQYYDVTAMALSHYAVRDVYQALFVPTLATGQTPPIAPGPVPGVPTGGGPAIGDYATALRYEMQLLLGSGVKRPIAQDLLKGFKCLNRLVSRGNMKAVERQIAHLERYIARRIDRGIPAEVASQLLGLLQQGRALLLGQGGTPE